MKDKTYLLKVFTIAAWASLLVWNGIMFIADPNHHITQPHKEILLGGYLLWFVTILFDRNANDDDWAGEF